jgi:pyruvate-formate lyase-activating enzyme
LTGGEPLLVPEVIKSVVARVREENPKAPVIVYTAWREDPELLLDILQIVDGITLTLHTRKDTAPLETFSELVSKHELNKVKSLRLNVFRGVSTGTADLAGWDVRKGLAWIKECPLPQDEVFMRLRTAT